MMHDNENIGETQEYIITVIKSHASTRGPSTYRSFSERARYKQTFPSVFWSSKSYASEIGGSVTQWLSLSL